MFGGNCDLIQFIFQYRCTVCNYSCAHSLNHRTRKQILRQINMDALLNLTYVLCKKKKHQVISNGFKIDE